jgi:hypothetical protein
VHSSQINSKTLNSEKKTTHFRKTKLGKKGKTFFLYDPAINIHIISYLLTKKKKRKGKIFFVLIYQYELTLFQYIYL